MFAYAYHNYLKNLTRNVQRHNKNKQIQYSFNTIFLIEFYFNLHSYASHRLLSNKTSNSTYLNFTRE